MFRLCTFGGCFLERDGRRLDGLSAQRKGFGLLARLAAAGDAGLSRDAAAASLWPESDEIRAAASLKQQVHSLRQQLGDPDVLLGPATLRLNPELVTSDVAEFRTALKRGDVDAAVALYTGPFLDGFLIRGADPFERWAAAERAILAGQFDDALEQLGDRASTRGDWLAAAQWWRRRQATDPLSGRVAVQLMRALDRSGDRAAAVRHANVHAELLRQELGPSATFRAVSDFAAELARAPVVPVAGDGPIGATDAGADSQAFRRDKRDVQPTATATGPDQPIGASPATAAVIAPPVARAQPRRVALLVGCMLAVVAVGGYVAWRAMAQRGLQASPVATSGPTSPVSARSVAVLPFANTSGDAADEPFADGLTDELIGALGQVAGLKVTPRTSAFALKGKGLDVRTAADTLGVATALEGSVRRAGDRLRITVALVSAAENRVLWSESYDRERRDIFAVQREIALAVVRALRVTIDSAAAVRTVRRSPADHVAYELFMRGEFYRLRLSTDGLQRSIAFFEQAIARDPTFARAHAGLADAHALLVLFGARPPMEGFRRARRSAVTALSLDSTLAQAHASLGHIEMAHDWSWASADRRLARGLALDPMSTTIRVWRGLWLLDQRRFDESAALLERALIDDPLAAPISLTLGRIYVSTRRPDRAIPYLTRAIELNARFSLAHNQLGYALLQQGRTTDAITAFERAAVLGGARDSAELAGAYAITGRRDDAQRIVRTLAASARVRYVSPLALAIAYTGLGDIDAAFRSLEQAYGEHAAGMDAIAITTPLQPLHSDPRWKRLLDRMNLPT